MLKTTSAIVLSMILPGLFCGAQPGRADLSPAVRERCLEILRQALNSAKFWPSMHAAEALTVTGHAQEVRPILKKRLQGEQDDLKRCGLARELARAGDRSTIPILLEILARPGLDAQTHAAESLYKIGAVGDKDLLEKLMQDSHAGLRLMAAATLARSGDAAALAQVRRELSSKEPEASYLAAWILGRLGNRGDIPDLLRLARNTKDSKTRAFASHALACLGDETGKKALENDLNASDAEIRSLAGEAVAFTRQSELTGKLTKLLDDQDLDVRIRAALALLVLARPNNILAPPANKPPQ